MYRRCDAMNATMEDKRRGAHHASVIRRAGKSGIPWLPSSIPRPYERSRFHGNGRWYPPAKNHESVYRTLRYLWLTTSAECAFAMSASFLILLFILISLETSSNTQSASICGWLAWTGADPSTSLFLHSIKYRE